MDTQQALAQFTAEQLNELAKSLASGMSVDTIASIEHVSVDSIKSVMETLTPIELEYENFFSEIGWIETPVEVDTNLYRTTLYLKPVTAAQPMTANEQISMFARTVKRFGVDVSKYQGTIDWAKAKAAGVEFAILRAGYGRYMSQKDPTFEANYSGCCKNGIPVGAYWYLYCTTNAHMLEEMRCFMECLNGKQFEYPVYLDIEDKAQAAMGKSALTQMLQTGLTALESGGYYPGVYTYTSYAPRFDYVGLASRYPTWLADYRKNYDTTLPRDMHQYSSSGSVNGINGRCDVNWCYTDFPTIIRNSGKNGFVGGGTTVTSNSCMVKIGPASGGDRKTVVNTATANNVWTDEYWDPTDGNDYVICGPASTSQMAQVISKAKELLGDKCVTDMTDITLKIGPVSAGDRKAIVSAANEAKVTNEEFWDADAGADYVLCGPDTGTKLAPCADAAAKLGLGISTYTPKPEEPAEPETPVNPEPENPEPENPEPEVPEEPEEPETPVNPEPENPDGCPDLELATMDDLFNALEEMIKELPNERYATIAGYRLMECRTLCEWAKDETKVFSESAVDRARVKE